MTGRSERNLKNYRPLTCRDCSCGAALGFDFSMAFQPIVDIATEQVFAQEALVRGTQGEPAATVLARVNEENRYRFDQVCRVRAVQLAAKLGISTAISINFLPNAVYQPELCLRTTIEAAETFGFPLDRIIFEFTEGERIEDPAHLKEIVQYYKQRGFRTAIDDFGAGYAGLNLLADYQTDLIKLDMALIRGIEGDRGRQAIVKGIVQVCRDLGIIPIAEGVETATELEILCDFGITLFQGYYFAKPIFEAIAVLSPHAFERGISETFGLEPAKPPHI